MIFHSYHKFKILCTNFPLGTLSQNQFWEPRDGYTISWRASQLAECIMYNSTRPWSQLSKNARTQTQGEEIASSYQEKADVLLCTSHEHLEIPTEQRDTKQNDINIQDTLWPTYNWEEAAS